MARRPVTLRHSVSTTSPFYRFIETLVHNGASGGCLPASYCPSQGMSRAAMAVFVLVAVSSDSRMRRITAFLQENCTQFDNEDCWQIQQCRFALANGGIFGVGLGNSTAKWSW